MTDTFLSARWENLIMANYEVPPEVLAPYLPNGVELDFYNNKTYVSLVGFMFKRTSLFHVPIPLLGTFEEINLRFYVKRIEGNTVKRGVVFINETVPYKLVAWLANKLYKEHYMAIPTKNLIENTEAAKHIKYEWKINKSWNHIAVTTSIKNEEMALGSMEEFIFEHYYGYTKINGQLSQEYKVNHPRWFVNKVIDYSIDCDFAAMYGNDFSFLGQLAPNSVIVAEGSPVTVKWKRTTF
ncbi:YqjF family protein [Parasediminibacterium sp. JCM 36343]|uniref:YqjF family protein n=1 Tax=Parasediminibacterium sp. JCM 36343 TaxID=3374279 RepID=UPI00397BA044